MLRIIVLLGTAIASLATPFDTVAASDAPIAIAVHGGAGTIRRADLSTEKEKAVHQTLERALKAGHARLSAGASATDAVQAAIVVLEDSPHFNAGKGAVFNSQGFNELDAAIMDGNSRNAGAVTGVRHVRNPILLANRVMTQSPHVMLAGAGAEEFALSQGFDLVPGDYFHTDFRWQQFQKVRAKISLRESEAENRFGTVGAVALDKNGNIAAGTSTGGMTNKRFGRIGDVPVIGAGTFADNRSCAVSATGHGEYFIRAVVGHDIAARMRYAGLNLAEASEQVVLKDLVEMGGGGGVIAINTKGDIALVHNTPGMYRGSIDVNGKVITAIYKSDD
ncbi:MAG: isoaspartyl peptidase/L-asparaginase [Pseudomonadota bacterium]